MPAARYRCSSDEMPTSERLRTALGLGMKGSLPPQSGAVRAHRPHRAVLGATRRIGKSRLVRAPDRGRVPAGWLRRVGTAGQAGSTLAYPPLRRFDRPGSGDSARASPTRYWRLHPGLTRLTAYRAGPAEATVAAATGLVAESVHALLAESGSRRHQPWSLSDVHWRSPPVTCSPLLLTRGFPSKVSLPVTHRPDDLHRRHLHDTPSPCGPGSPSVDHPELGSRSPRRHLSSLSPPSSASVSTRGERRPISSGGRGQPFRRSSRPARSQPRPRPADGLRSQCGSDRAPDETALQGRPALAVAERDVSHVMLSPRWSTHRVRSRRRGVRRRGTPRRGDLLAPAYRLQACAALGEVVLDQPLPGERLPPPPPVCRRALRAPAARPGLPSIGPGMRWRAETETAARCEPRSRRTGHGGRRPAGCLGAPERALDLLQRERPVPRRGDPPGLRPLSPRAIRCSPCGSWPTG